jgi:hypothetical protein
MERDAVLSGTELGLWDAEIRSMDRDCPPNTGS